MCAWEQGIGSCRCAYISNLELQRSSFWCKFVVHLYLESGSAHLRIDVLDMISLLVEPGLKLGGGKPPPSLTCYTVHGGPAVSALHMGALHPGESTGMNFTAASIAA